MASDPVDKFLMMLDRVCERPSLFVGRPSLRLVTSYIYGYEHAIENVTGISILAGLMDWVQMQHDICHCAWHWTRILHHALGTEEAVIAALPALIRQFMAERDAIGGVEELHYKYLKQFPPNRFVEPASTHTKSFTSDNSD